MRLEEADEFVDRARGVPDREDPQACDATPPMGPPSVQVGIKRPDRTTGQQQRTGLESRTRHRSIHSTNAPTLSVTTITRSTRSL